MQKTVTGRAVGQKATGSALQKASWGMIIAFLLPSVVLVAFFSYYPAIDGILMSFQKCNSRDLFTRPWVGLKNYSRIFDRNFWFFWLNTAKWTIGSVALELVIGFILALLLQKPFRGKGLYEAIVFVPWALSSFVVGVIFRWIFNSSSGVLNDLLLRLGLIQDRINWLADPTLAMGSCILAKVWTGFSFFGIVLMSAMQTIPREIYESAEIDGANGVQRFIYVTLPHLKVILTYGVLLRALGNFGNIDIILGVTGGGPAGATQTVMSYVMLSFRGGEALGSNYGILSAFGVIIWLFLLTMTILYLTGTRVMKKED